MTRLSFSRTNAAQQSAELACCLAAIAIIALATSPLHAQGTNSFTLKFSEKEMKLEHPSDMKWDKYLMWDLAFQRMNDRNMPYIELTNNSSSVDPIKELHLTIGDTRFNFSDDVMGKFAMVGSSTPGFNITSSTVGNFGDELVVSIGDGGLEPGEVVRFKIDLAVDPAFAGQIFAHPDYRTVLFDMNGFNVYDGLQQQSSADNAKAWAIFDPPIGPDTATIPVSLQDELVSGSAADFYNNNYRRYGEMDPVRTFLVEGGGEAVIPEPTGVLLASMAIAAGLVWWSGPRRGARN
jgi:hypothetical protein